MGFGPAQGASVVSDPETNALAGVTSAANKVPYFTGSGAADVADFTAAGRALVDDADASAQRTTLGLGTIATQAASAVSITGGAISGITDLPVADGGTGSSTASDARTALGLAIGTNVQAYSAKTAYQSAVTSFTPTGNVTNCTWTGLYRHTGKMLECQFYGILTNTPGAANFALDFPAGFTVDTAFFLADGYSYLPCQGMLYDTSAASDRIGLLRLSNGGVLQMYYIATGNGGIRGLVTATTPFTWAVNDIFNFRVILPVNEVASA